MSSEVRLPLTSLPPNENRIDALKALFPDAFTEDKIDFDRLKRILGGAIQTDRERYGLNWAGKANAIHALQYLSVGTLKPVREESVNFDTTENLIIEGDNLEVLKLLQKSYFGKVKMIYIDPPYNTGNEFIYPDNFREGLEDYLKYSGQKSSEGTATSSTRETDGRYHSKWLSMMYPRLFLAKNLLSDEGSIFISIDDHEIHNLRLLMNDIFGEEYFTAEIIVRANSRGQTYKQIAKTHEYLLVYTKSLDAELLELEKRAEMDDLDCEDAIGRFNIRELRNRNPKFGRHNRPNLFYPIYVNTEALDEDGYAPVSLNQNETYFSEVLPLNSQSIESCWRWGKKLFVQNVGIDTMHSTVVAKQKQDGSWGIYEKYRKTTYKPKSIWDENTFLTETGTVQLRELELAEYFPFPKPVELIKRCVQLATVDGDIVLDFFAGSGTTAQAVFEVNKEDSGNRRFILAQLPEKTGIEKFPTIVHILRERVRRVIKKMNESDETVLNMSDEEQDRGFKALRLTASNFKIWEGREGEADEDAIAAQLELFADNLLPDATPEDILFEILIKSGYDLNVPREEISIAGQPVYSIAEGESFICLEREINRETLEGMIERKPKSVICLDEAFHGDDALLTNTLLQMQDADINFHTI